MNEALAQMDIHDKVSVEIERIYVRRKFQGQGFGMYLMENVIQIALQRKSVIFG
ncbi:GNAT family N-acetyltransferase [Faecalicoccus pleomorphus]|uniref:GNAT family N-acetyltransferase n=1 Tax=Faecalicoccus pleomorphus TaxID=1323 RepID=UPI0039F58019